MDLQFWCSSRLSRLDFAVRRHVTFYAPLTDSLDFMGVEPATFTRAGTGTRTGRDGLTHNIGVNVPPFYFDGDQPTGLWMVAGETLQFSASNNLSDGNTFMWMENGSWKTTPTDTNPYNSSGIYSGNLSVLTKHHVKFDRVMTPTEMTMAAAALTDPPTIPPEIIGEPPATYPSGAFVSETPAGVRNGVNTVFTLSQNPDLNSVALFCFGVGPLERVSGTPDQLQFTLSGTGNRTLTMGLGPTTAYPFFVIYVTAET